jgi:aminoglycoside phosphotransferase family enzyme/predicted kinase
VAPIDPQTAVIAFLSSAEAFGDQPVQRIDTHLSHIFLAGKRAFKMKRAVKYDFADFSTLELRRRACEKEVEVNRRTAPELYLGALPIYRRGEVTFDWTGDGPPVEWVVEMRRFDGDRQLDVLVERNALAAGTIARLADRIAAFHLRAERPEQVEQIRRLNDVIEQISTALLKGGLGPQRKEDIVRWTSAARLEGRRNERLLALRARHGWVRRCHGDLHLANVCMLDGEPTPFDAIEFNDELATIDVLYDLAFLLMDLARFGRGDLASLVLNRYLSVTRDYGGAGLLRLFQSVRAAVRAMVLSLPGQPDSSREKADRYLDLALCFLSSPSAPRLIAIGGYSGTGKSTVAATLAPDLDKPHGAILLQSDVIRKRLCGVAPETRLGEEGYTPATTNAVYQRMLKDACRAVRAGATVILDATFLNEAFRRPALAAAQQLRVAFHGFWLTAAEAVLRDRISKRAGGASDATAAILERQLRAGAPPADWLPITAEGAPDAAARDILRALSKASGGRVSI